MDSSSTYDDFPWELILSALQGNLSPDDDARFREWLALVPDNRQMYDRLERTWKQGMSDYPAYRDIDEIKAWEALQGSMAERGVVRASPGTPGRRVPMIRRWIAVAAVFLLAAGAGWWYLALKNAPILYETAMEGQKLALPDGSTISIKPQTRIQVSHGYNKTGRTVILSAGEAHFDVSHQANLPFIVDLDVASVKDIGTDFTIERTKDSIKVTVSGGKVAFLKKETGESREVSAGSSLVYFVRDQRFGDISPAGDGSSMRFDNAPLADVIAALEKMSGKKILLEDAAIGQKRLTVHLDGESFDNAMKIVCASLNLEYNEMKGVNVLKARDSIPNKHY